MIKDFNGVTCLLFVYVQNCVRVEFLKILWKFLVPIAGIFCILLELIVTKPITVQLLIFYRRTNPTDY